MNIFVVKIMGLEEIYKTNLINLPSFPIELIDTVDNSWSFKKYFSSRRKALAKLKEYLSNTSKQEFNKILYITIQEFSLDNEESGALEVFSTDLKSIQIYDDRLNKPFNGINKPSKYKIGQWVIFHDNCRLHCGIVAATPWTKKEVEHYNFKGLDQYDNSYLLLWDNMHEPKDVHAHSHSFESTILKKIKTPSGYLTNDTIFKLEQKYKSHIQTEHSRRQPLN